MVPVENSTEGTVNVTLDRLIDTDVLITGEVTLDITQHLLSRASDLADVKTVCSHPQALAQCRQWLAAHLPDVAAEDMPSTTAAAARAKDDPTVAAIASEMAARWYEVPILRRVSRTTRRTRHASSSSGVAGGTRHRPGQDVHPVLDEERAGRAREHPQPFAARRLNLTKIESRPTKRRPWEYVNFVDFEGHRDTDVVRDVLAEIKERCQFLKVLGSYPAA